MTHTFYQHFYHIIWSTKDHKPLMSPEIRGDIFSYIAGSFKTLKCNPIQVGGVWDHVHILADIPPKLCVSDVIRDVKVCSSKWVNNTLIKSKGSFWQEGYGSFVVSSSLIPKVVKYIQNQEFHHKGKTFREEFIMFLDKLGVEYDEKYLWK